ncbi:MAG: hypothetical protein IK015_06995 [Treponema sp.]|nr:hypothetical protein [Treponema sp.]
MLLFLDKFYYIDNEYRFEAKFVDINTMQTISYMLAYSGNKLKEPKETLERINFRTFTKISSTENPFADEFPLLVASKFRMPQNRKIVFANKRNGCPLGYGKRIDFSEYDLNRPKTVLLDVSSITFDGAGSVELKFGENCKSGTYTFEPCDLYVEKIENDYYTDCKIGNLSIQTDSGYEKFDVYTINNREYYLRLGSAELPKVTVNYYLQMVKN